ncbi:hypothetical protein IE53DRAFT_389581 [Violaceomyces palustris]|uniref:Uncharacterized protein n=1 Tax=Violaceomyces palustris TaxID=1673888 RepID=A0ACD0NR33_9BASI|nr:hypothetical protein IE53DRAFT_389581 [Violaceomyces palustris]
MTDLEKKRGTNAEDISLSSNHQEKVARVREQVDAFHVDEDDGTRINFKTMGWVKAGALIMAETIALGILSFPLVFHRLGMATGIMVTVALAIMSTWTGWQIVDFKVNHPGVMNFADAGRVMWGKWGGYAIGTMLIVKVTFVAGSHSLSGAIALSNISSNAVCSIVYAVVISVVSFLLTVPRTFEKVSYISFLSVASILVACLITIVASGTQSLETLQTATDKELGPVEWFAGEHHGLIDVINAITNIVFAYGGHVAIFSFASEMKEPADFKYSLILVQVVATSWYILVGATIYSFVGQYAVSPALTATAKAVRITSYSIALISIIVAGVVASYVGAKFVWIQLFRGSETLTSSSYRTWSYWVGICATLWTVAFVISQVIPFFSDLLSIISSLFTVWLTYGLSSFLWLHDNHPSRSELLTNVSGRGGYFSTRWKGLLFFFNLLMILFSAAIMGLGTYSAVKAIKDGYDQGDFGGPFSCSS